MRVLIVSTNRLPASPSGPAYVAGAVRQAGHQVAVYESLFASDLPGELSARIREFQPEVVGVSIRLVHGDVQDSDAPYGTRYIDLRPPVKEIVQTIRRSTNARIVLGGPGFNYYACDWLDYLELDTGLRGEGEEAFPLLLARLEEGGDIHSIPGIVTRQNAGFHTLPPRPVEDLNGTALPAYDLFDLEKYASRHVTPAIFTKRGCGFRCIYCPYSKLEGSHYRLKSPERVLAEIRHVLKGSSTRRIMFCDNNFNVPRRHAEALCRAFLAGPLDFQWGTGDLRPAGVTSEFCQLLSDSGCFYANLSIESASDSMLKRLRRGYTVQQVRQALEALSGSQIPFGASLMFGAPGETPDTIAETLRVLSEYPISLGVWVTIGIYLWTGLQDVVAEARLEGSLKDGQALFSGPVYRSPGLPNGYLVELVDRLRLKPGYTVQVNRSDLLFQELLQ